MERLQAFGFPLQIDCHKLEDEKGEGRERVGPGKPNRNFQYNCWVGQFQFGLVPFCFCFCFFPLFWWHGQGNNWSSLIRYSQDGKTAAQPDSDEDGGHLARGSAMIWAARRQAAQASECLAICCHYWPINFDVHLTMMIGSGGRNDFAFESLLWDSPQTTT